MQAIRRIGLIAAFAANYAYAQPAQSPREYGTAGTSEGTGAPPAEALPIQSGSDKGKAVIPLPPVPPQLAPLSQDFQAAMANSQLQTYRYNQLTEQALALKKLCDTGFGPSDICPKAYAAPADGVLTTNSAALPMVSEISGSHGALSAVIILADGRRLSVRRGSLLPDGLHVTGVTEDDVRVSTGVGREVVLSFGATVPAK